MMGAAVASELEKNDDGEDEEKEEPTIIETRRRLITIWR